MITQETPRVFKEVPGLEIDEQLISIHSINPFIPSASASRRRYVIISFVSDVNSEQR